MKVVRLFSGADGRSHFEELDIELSPTMDGEMTSPISPIAGAQVRRTPAGGFWDFHRADSPKYMFILGGQIEIGVGGGVSRKFGAGDIVLVEDTEGQGHTLRVLGDRDRVCVDIKLA